MDTLPPDGPRALDAEEEDPRGAVRSDPDGRTARPVPVAPFDPLPPFAVPVVWLLGLFLVPFLAMGMMFLALFDGRGSEPSSSGPLIAVAIVWTLVCVRLFFVRRRRARRRADPERRPSW